MKWRIKLAWPCSKQGGIRMTCYMRGSPLLRSISGKFKIRITEFSELEETHEDHQVGSFLILAHTAGEPYPTLIFSEYSTWHLTILHSSLNSSLFNFMFITGTIVLNVGCCRSSRGKRRWEPLVIINSNVAFVRQATGKYWREKQVLIPWQEKMQQNINVAKQTHFFSMWGWNKQAKKHPTLQSFSRVNRPNY